LDYLKTRSYLLIFLAGFISCNQADKNSANSSAVEVQNVEKPKSISGAYDGVTPCADCPGIETTVLFKPDYVFVETLKYKERNTSFADTGRWSISHKIITVSFSKQGNERFFLIKNDSSVAILDANKKEINGAIGKLYILKKIK
jgi:uncharacterized lipoprotein NlpE involved in copper resistance